ncbi:MAG: hypothetical protein HQL51_15380 [Magnetococcales bacterium]|nr:hypothetical protein [Magnetococcales bacterium]
MIPVKPPPEPADFDAKVRKLGSRWLDRHPDAPARPKDYWKKCRIDLAKGFHHLCAYGAMFEPAGTVDHFISISQNRELAYEWCNYRYASGWINSSKQNPGGILDPFLVQEGWFEIILPSLQLRITDKREC